MSTNHCWYQFLCIFINFAAVVGTILVILTSFSKHYGFGEPLPNLLDNGTVAVDEAFPTPITPCAWVQTLWLVVYAWMFLWSTHSVISICRKFAGVPVYVSPSLVNSALLLFSTGSCLLTITWFVLYDREYVTTATLIGLAITCCAWTAYLLSLHSLHSCLPRLEKGERMGEAWAHRLLVQNGLALLGVWSLFITVYSLCITLIHNDDIHLEQDTAGVVSLSVLAFFLILYVILDVSVMDRFTRYTVFPYVIPIAVLCASIFREDSWPSDSVIFLLLATLTAFSFLAIMLKAACSACRLMAEGSNPQQTDDRSKDDLTHYLSSASSVGYLYEGRNTHQ